MLNYRGPGKVPPALCSSHFSIYNHATPRQKGQISDIIENKMYHYLFTIQSATINWKIIKKSKKHENKQIPNKNQIKQNHCKIPIQPQSGKKLEISILDSFLVLQSYCFHSFFFFFFPSSNQDLSVKPMNNNSLSKENEVYKFRACLITNSSLVFNFSVRAAGEINGRKGGYRRLKNG